jgi:hypothetical protein
MYSGNHSPANPLDTIVDAAKRLEDDPRLLFMFIGGGIGKEEIDRSAGKNVISLPYQPRGELRNSLSAADVHIVTIGDAVPGIVHPSKVYGAMAVGRPIMAQHDIGWHVRHGDVEGAVRVLKEIASLPREELEAKGRRAYEAIVARGGRKAALGKVVDILEAASLAV